MSIEIPSQNAENIYNVAGNMHLYNSPEVHDLLNKQKQAELHELYSIPFLEVLTKDMSEKVLLDRTDEVGNITEVVKIKNQLFLYGEPGIGKTTILFQFATKLNGVIYISVKDKSPINILSYLINKIRQADNLNLLEVNDVNKAFEWLTTSLQNTQLHIIIDDCENDVDTVSKIATIEKFNNIFLFATRNKSPFERIGVTFYECRAFSQAEIKTFLTLNGKQLPTLEFNRLCTASKGNPLYLFYFTKFQIIPLPQNLMAFQQSIWTNLTATQQEILSLIAIPHFSINTTQLAEILFFNLPLELVKFLDELSALIYNLNGSLQIFHPSFKEFVLDALYSKGLLNHYRQKLGDYFLLKNEIVQATYLLLEIAPEKIDQFLYNVFPRLLSWGEMQFAIKVLNRMLLKAKKNNDKGYIYFHLSNAHSLLGNKSEAHLNTDQSILCFKKSKDKRFLAAAMMSKATNLVDQGKISEATQIADKIFSELKPDDKKMRAPFLVTLAKIYVDMSETNKAALASKEAFEIFEELDDPQGMISSLVNLVSSLAQNGSYRDDAEMYGLQLLEIINDETDFSVEVVVLNAMTSIYREKKEFEKAKSYSMRAIALCQKYEMKDREILNLVNYANILRDEGNIVEAKKIYNEALIFTTQYNLKKDEGRICWILASIELNENNYQTALKWAEKSIAICSSINFYYGVANAYREKAEIYEQLGDPLMAAEAYKSSADFYIKMEQYTQSYRHNISKAINLYNSLGYEEESNSLLNLLIEQTFKDEDFDGITKVITNNSSNESIIENFRLFFQKYFSHLETHSNIIHQFLSFIDFCNKIEPVEGRSLFMEILLKIVDSGFIAKYSYSTLAMAVEQSRNLLSDEDLNKIYSRLQTTLPFLSARYVGDEYIILTSIADKVNLEIHVFDNELICRKLALSLLLLLHERTDLVISDDTTLERNCTMLLQVYSKEMEAAVGEMFPPRTELFTEHMQSAHMTKADYSVYEMIVVSPEYEIICDLSNNGEGKGSLYFISNALIGLKEHFYHSEIRYDFEKRKPIVKTVAALLGYTDVEGEHTKIPKFTVNLGKILQKIHPAKAI